MTQSIKTTFTPIVSATLPCIEVDIPYPDYIENRKELDDFIDNQAMASCDHFDKGQWFMKKLLLADSDTVVEELKTILKIKT
jgi:hypothetical protein